jgi:hypothetical protein
MLMTQLSCVILGFGNIVYDLVQIDRLTAKTTIRLWHELHVEKKVAHDFLDLLAPCNDHMYFAAVRYDEIRGIARCVFKNEILTVQKFAYPPEEHYAIHSLLLLLNDDSVAVDWKVLQSQPRWYYEKLFMDANTADVGSSNNM